MTEIECVLMFRACYVRLSLDRTSLSDSSSCHSDKYLLPSISDLLWWNTRGLSYHLLVVIYILLRGWPGARNVIRKRSDSKDRRAADRKLSVRCDSTRLGSNSIMEIVM